MVMYMYNFCKTWGANHPHPVPTPLIVLTVHTIWLFMPLQIHVPMYNVQYDQAS